MNIENDPINALYLQRGSKRMDETICVGKILPVGRRQKSFISFLVMTLQAEQMGLEQNKKKLYFDHIPTNSTVQDFSITVESLVINNEPHHYRKYEQHLRKMFA
ncbi:hypothetical protein Tsp_03521 [Trichinella spiralis]|uniref:hypothetical protein n=1 Tax=Trichinella spiralis TaxID=6334 RepID=UPI0001EFB425|nr:hypothetical protein Tsp_03521 [Trichinella spiralis]